MADVITFTCTGCSKPYRVAISYAGRDFACKACGASLSVPQPDAQPLSHETDVQLDSGAQVIRRTSTSGRHQEATDPTRVFVNSARMAAVAPAPQTKQKSKTPLIAAAAVVVLLVVGLGAAIALGAFSSNDTANGQQAQTNTPAGPVNEESERNRIMAQLDTPGQHAADFMKLLQRAEQANLEQFDRAAISRAVVSAMLAESGAGFSDADLMAFAGRAQSLNLTTDAESLYALVISRGKSSAQPSPEFKQAHEKLGHGWADIEPQVESAGLMHDSGIIEGMDKLRGELLEIEKRADQGWLAGSDKRRFDEIVKLLETARAEYDTVARADPFRIKAAGAQRLFKLEKASKQGKWVTLTRDPFVFFVQLHSGENAEAAEKRLESALAAAEQFTDFYREQLVGALELKRMLPTGLSQAERDEAPLVIKLFRDASYLKAHLDDLGAKVTVSLATTFTEPGTGHLSMAYKEHADSLGTFITALIGLVMYNYHPHAPTTKAEDDAFKSYSAFFLNDYFHASVANTGPDEAGLDFNFFKDDARISSMLQRWRLPFAKAANGKINSFGGQVLTARDVVVAKTKDDLYATAKAKLATLDGWDEADLQGVSTAGALHTIVGYYELGLYQFLYHWGPDGTPKYRDQFMKFVRMDLAGEVDKADPLPAFSKAFGLDDAGWKKLEADFTAYQS